MKSFLLSLLAIFFGIYQSPKIYKSKNYRRTITVINDTILSYSEINGCFGNSNTLNYKNINGKFIVRGNPNTKKSGLFSLSTDLSGSELKISTDSIVIVKTGEILYDVNYLTKEAEKQFQNFYIIIENKKIFVTSKNYDELFTDIDLQNYILKELKKASAKRRYGIDKRYRTLKLERK